MKTVQLFLCVLCSSLITALGNSSVVYINDFPPQQLKFKTLPRKVNKYCDCVIDFDTRAYPGQFFYHLHIPKTGGMTFLDCLRCWDREAESDTASYEDGWTCDGVNINKLKDQISKKLKNIVSCEIKVAGQLNSFLTSANMPKMKIITHIRKPTELIFSAIIQYYTDPRIINPCRNFRELIQADASPDAIQCERYVLQNMQTAALSPRKVANITEAIAFLSKNIFHFGMTSYYRASLCLLAFQLKQLKMHSAVCDCRRYNQSVLRHSNRNHDKVGHTKISDVKLLSASDMKVLESKYINMDNVLYQTALSLFLHRIIIAEKSANMQLLCAATDGEEIISLKSSVRETHWYGAFDKS